MIRTHGFTLIELLTTVALIAILTSIALPAFRDMVSNSRLLTSANDIVAAFHQARSEALKASRTVLITACKPGCGSTGTQDWSNGWQTSVSGNVIAEHAALPGNITAGAHGAIAFATSYGYSSQGRLDINNTNEIILCDDNRTGEAGRLITLKPIGHVTVSSITCT